jgi:ankyrin repeat protein
MENAMSRHRSKGADKWPPHRVDDLFSFAARERWDWVDSALDAGFPVNAAGTRIDSLLHLAARYGCMPILRRLLASGAHVDVRGRYQRAPAHYAALYGFVDGLVALVEAGADVNVRDSLLDTPLHKAVFCSLPCTRYLLSLPQVDLSATDENGYTAEHAARKDGQTATADAVRAVVRAASWGFGGSSYLCSLVWLPPTTSL